MVEIINNYEMLSIINSRASDVCPRIHVVYFPILLRMKQLYKTKFILSHSELDKVYLFDWIHQVTLVKIIKGR